MAVDADQLTVTDDEAVELTVSSESDYSSGYSVLATADGPLHFGPSGVTNSGGNRGALHPAGTYPFNNLGTSDRIYVIAPAGLAVTVERLLVGI